MAQLTLQQHYQTTFFNNWLEIMSQQLEHRLAGLYEEYSVDGNSYRLDQMGGQSFAARQKSARYATTQPSDVPTGQRWLRPMPWDITTWVDEDDPLLLGKLTDPTSMIVRNHAIAFNRLKDFVILTNLLGNAYIGNQGQTSVALPQSNQLAVTAGSGSSNSGLQLFKLTNMSFIMDSFDVPNEDRVLVVAAKQINDLLTSVDQVNNVLYNDIRALKQGTVQDFMGFTIKRTQLLPFVVGSGTLRQIVAYQKNYVALGIGQDLITHVDILPGNSHTWQIRSKMNLTAQRKEEPGVVSAICDETL